MTKRERVYGGLRLSDRDIEMLRWIGEQYAVSFDHLPTLEHLITQKMPEDPFLRYKGIHALTSRWLRGGLIEQEKIFARKPMWVWLTAKGVKATGLDAVSMVPSVARLQHIHAVNSVRLYVEKKLENQDIRWIPEREANALRKIQKKTHLVDGEIEYPDDHRVAVEVELTQKDKTRLRSILRQLQRDYDSVLYYASNKCYTAVQNAIKEIPNHEDTFMLKKLSSLEESV